MDEKVIITVAPTGAWPSKADNPAVPVTPEEIAELEEKERQTKEKERQAKEKADCELAAKERRRVEQDFDRALSRTPGTLGQHIDQSKALMEAWDKAENRKEFEKDILQQLRERTDSATGT